MFTRNTEELVEELRDIEYAPGLDIVEAAGGREVLAAADEAGLLPLPPVVVDVAALKFGLRCICLAPG